MRGNKGKAGKKAPVSSFYGGTNLWITAREKRAAAQDGALRR